MEMYFVKFVFERRLGQRSSLLHCMEALMMDVNVEVPIPRSFLPKAFN